MPRNKKKTVVESDDIDKMLNTHRTKKKKSPRKKQSTTPRTKKSTTPRKKKSTSSRKSEVLSSSPPDILSSDIESVGEVNSSSDLNAKTVDSDDIDNMLNTNRTKKESPRKGKSTAPRKKKSTSSRRSQVLSSSPPGLLSTDIESAGDVKSSPDLTAETTVKSIYGVYPAEALALGIGDPDNIGEHDLLKFFDIVGKPSENYQEMSITALRTEARRYLVQVTAKQLLSNALKLSHSKTHVEDRYFKLIRNKIQEYTAEMQNAVEVVQSSIGKFEEAIASKNITEKQRDKFNLCLAQLKKFQKELESYGLVATHKEGIVAGAKRGMRRAQHNWKKTAVTAGLGVAGALLLTKLVWDHSLIQKWVTYTPIPYQNPVKSALHKLTFRKEEKWRQWLEKRSQFKVIYDRIKEKKGDDFNDAMTKGLMDYVETAPSLDEIKLFIEKKPSIFDKFLLRGSKPRELWSSILSKLEKPLTKIKYYPDAVDKAYEKLKKNDDEVDKLTKIVLGVLKPGFYRAMMAEDVSTLIDEYLNIGNNKEQVITRRVQARLNAAMLQWAANMPYNVETKLTELIRAMNSAPTTMSKFLESKDSKYLVTSGLSIKFPHEKSIVNWLYQCPVLGEVATSFVEKSVKWNSILNKMIRQRQKDIVENAEPDPDGQEWGSQNIKDSLFIMIKGDIHTKPAYFSLKKDVTKMEEEEKKPHLINSKPLPRGSY